MNAQKSPTDPVFIDGRRLPFQKSGSGYAELSAYDLARMAIRGLIEHGKIAAELIEAVVLGSVIQDVDTANVAREAALASGIPEKAAAHTVSMACISSNQAIATLADSIRLGRVSVGIAGGTETLSDVPIRFKRKVRRKLIESQKAKSPADYARLLSSIRPSDLMPDVPAISEHSTGETMGQSADRLAARWGVSRRDQDEYALLSHHRAAEARRLGILADEIVPAFVGRDMSPITLDNGIRADSTLDALSKLRPAFVKPYGTVTAGNASFLTDGASAILLASREAAERQGWIPRAVLRDHVFVGQSPSDELLLGPAYAVPAILRRAGLALEDIDVFEVHEAFAGQLLAVQRALASQAFARDRLGLDDASGPIPIDKMNVNGGSLSLGHPFGATGARLVMSAVRRLERENGRWALVAACAAGGLGHAMLIEHE